MTDEAETRHPYNHRHLIPDSTRFLIVGTAPPPHFFQKPFSPKHKRDFEFYYGSGRNCMWRILPEALDKAPLSEPRSSENSVQEACQLLLEHRIWMYDVLAHVRRKSGHKSSSQDSHIKTPSESDFEDFRKVFEQAKNLQSIATTSERAFELLAKALKALGSIAGEVPSLAKWKNCNTSTAKDERSIIAKHLLPAAAFTLPDNRSITVYILPSPSRARRMCYPLKVMIYRRLLTSAGAYISRNKSELAKPGVE